MLPIHYSSILSLFYLYERQTVILPSAGPFLNARNS